MIRFFKMAKKPMYIIFSFLIFGLLFISMPPKMIVSFSEVWGGAANIFKVMKGIFILLLILNWQWCCERLCQFYGKPEMKNELVSKWPLIFGVIFVVELAGVWRDLH